MFPIRYAAALLLAVLAAPAAANDELLIQSPYVQAIDTVRWYVYVAGGVFGLFIVIVLGMYLTKVIRSGRNNDLTPYLNLGEMTTLKKKGLLTPEEAEKVRQAMIKQVERRTRQTRAQAPTPDMLLLDPEIKQLEQRARAKTIGAPPPDQARTDDTPAANAEEMPEFIAEEDDDLPELPSDIQALAAQGLLSDQEIANIRARLKAKRGAQGA